VDSLIHLCECGNHHNRVDVDALDAGAAGVDEGTLSLCIGNTTTEAYSESCIGWTYG
jgi:hypothetical protein